MPTSFLERYTHYSSNYTLSPSHLKVAFCQKVWFGSKIYSKLLSRAKHLNSPPITVNSLFKCSAQDSDLEFFYPQIRFIRRYEWIFLGEFIKVLIPLCSRPDKRDKHFVHDTNTAMNTSWNKLGDMYITDIITEWHTFSFTMLFFVRIHNKILQIVGIFHIWNKICIS